MPWRPGQDNEGWTRVSYRRGCKASHSNRNFHGGWREQYSRSSPRGVQRPGPSPSPGGRRRSYASVTRIGLKHTGRQQKWRGQQHKRGERDLDVSMTAGDHGFSPATKDIMPTAMRTFKMRVTPTVSISPGTLQN